MDIVLDEDGQQTGFLACTVEEYADAMVRIVSMSEMERLKMAAAARRQARRFSEQRFYDDFKAAVRPILSHTSRWWSRDLISMIVTLEYRPRILLRK